MVLFDLFFFLVYLYLFLIIHLFCFFFLLFFISFSTASTGRFYFYFSLLFFLLFLFLCIILSLFFFFFLFFVVLTLLSLEGISFLETSAKNGFNVEEAFAQIATEIINLQQTFKPIQQKTITPPSATPQEPTCSSCTT